MKIGRAWLLGTVLLAVTGCVESGAGRSAPPATPNRPSPQASTAPVSAASATAAPATAAPATAAVATGAAPAPAKASGRSTLPALVLAGSAIVTTSVGALLIVGAESRRATAYQLGAQTKGSCPIDDPQPEGLCAELLSVSAEADLMGNLGIGMLIAGGLLGAGAGVYLLFPAGAAQGSKATPKAGVRLVPFASAGVGGAVVQGTF